MASIKASYLLMRYPLREVWVQYSCLQKLYFCQRKLAILNESCRGKKQKHSRTVLICFQDNMLNIRLRFWFDGQTSFNAILCHRNLSNFSFSQVRTTCVNIMAEICIFRFRKVQWLQLTGEVCKSISCWCQIFSSFTTKLLKSVNLWKTEYYTRFLTASIPGQPG